MSLYFCVFDCGLRPTREFFTHMETLPLLVKGCKFWPMLATHSHWAVRYISVQHLLWYVLSVYNGHLRGPMTLSPLTERLAVELSLPILNNDIGLSRPGIEPRFPACKANALPLSHCGGYTLEDECKFECYQGWF